MRIRDFRSSTGALRSGAPQRQRKVLTQWRFSGSAKSAIRALSFCFTGFDSQWPQMPMSHKASSVELWKRMNATSGENRVRELARTSADVAQRKRRYLHLLNVEDQFDAR